MLGQFRNRKPGAASSEQGAASREQRVGSKLANWVNEQMGKLGGDTRHWTIPARLIRRWSAVPASSGAWRGSCRTCALQPHQLQLQRGRRNARTLPSHARRVKPKLIGLDGRRLREPSHAPDVCTYGHGGSGPA